MCRKSWAPDLINKKALSLLKLSFLKKSFLIGISQWTTRNVYTISNLRGENGYTK